ncbi:hypothetical protein [Amnibacterium kyonggiense]
MTSLTLLVVASWLFALYRRNPLLAVAFGGMTPSGAFVVLGGIALPTVYASVLFALLAYLLLRIDPSRPLGLRGITWLWVFALWVVIVTVTAPFLFAGTTVVALGGAERSLGPETFLTSSNIAQLLYLVLGVAAAAMAASRPQNAMWCIYLALAGAAVLSLWRYAGLNLGVPFPFDLFDNSPGFRYIDGAPGGVVRFRGILSEPAALAASSLACVAMGAALLRRCGGVRRVLVLVTTGVAIFNVTQSTSSTAVLVAVVLIIAAVVAAVGGLVLRGRRWSSAASIAAVVLVVVVAWALPIAGAYVQTVIDAKVGTSSYDERSSTDLYSYGLVLQTLGWGVGVGSNRPSSFLAALLAGTGVVGSVLFSGVVLRYSFRASRVSAIRPVLWCLFAILLAKLVASPDLSDTSGTMWLAIGALIGAASAHAAPAPDRLDRQPRHRTVEQLP